MPDETENQYQVKAYTLEARHIAIIEIVAREEQRTYSNALRIILDRYAALHLPDAVNLPY